jgi:uncharacterized protein
MADGLDHQLDPRVIPLERITGGIFVAVLAAASLIGITIALLAGDDIPFTIRLLLPMLWATLALLGAWQAYRWPPRSYAHTFYRVDDQGIEIRRGVHWRTVINVPRSRVQHIDVSQGPVDRRFGLGTLVIYTAGTDHARVELRGLEHGRALAIREHLLPPRLRDAEVGDAV